MVLGVLLQSLVPPAVDPAVLPILLKSKELEALSLMVLPFQQKSCKIIEMMVKTSIRDPAILDFVQQ